MSERRSERESGQGPGGTQPGGASARRVGASPAAALACLLATTLLGGATRAAEEAAPQVDLLGTWFVVMHYRDVATANPEADRWEDRVWVFERKGSRLHWTDYPIVVFEDGTGRFESRGGNTRARTLQAWMPNEAQRQEIAEGPQVNSRGSKTKSLRGSDARGYASTGGLRAQGAMTIGYHESWSIEDPTSLPVFTREDIMGTGRSTKAGGRDQTLEGVTRWTTTSIDENGTLHGTYRRDENRSGEFFMMRSGPVRDLETDGRTPNEKAFDRAREQLTAARQAYIDDLMERAKNGDEEARRELQEILQEMRDPQNRER